MNVPDKPFLKSSEVAGLFDVKISTVSLWVKKGRIRPHKTLGGNFRFKREDVEKLIADTQGTQTPGANRRKEPRFTVQYPVLVRVGADVHSYTYNAVVNNISEHGLGLMVFDTNGLSRMLTEQDTTELIVLNAPNSLFKELIAGRVKHVEQVEEGKLAVGVSLECGMMNAE